MRTLTKVLLPIFFLIITGCSTTPKEMRADVREKGVIKFDMPFSVVRTNFLMQAKKCYSRGFRTAYPVHVVDDVKPGEYTTLDIHLTGAPGMDMITHSFDIRKSATNETEISWFVAGLIVAKYQPVVESWARGQDGKCGTVEDK
jgi:hypothetical protein